jgi:hypothetical protein
MKHSFTRWNRSPSSAERSVDANDASNRIYDGYFKPGVLPTAPRFTKDDTVFAIGSCFARELEHVLRHRGFTISSIDRQMLSAVFGDENGKARNGFFHRFNIPSMELEIRRATGDAAFDEARDLLIETSADEFVDLHYHPGVLPAADLETTVNRRKAARQLVERISSSEILVVTLGLTEAWFHKPSGMYCNSVSASVIARRRNEFELRVIGIDENRRALASIYESIKRHHAGPFTLFLTVSPVPLSATFSDSDIVIATARSKATLRAVAEEFAEEHGDVCYFPSYEIAMYSNPAMVWRPDRLHIQGGCVEHIVSVFLENYVDVDGVSSKLSREAVTSASS